MIFDGTSGNISRTWGRLREACLWGDAPVPMDIRSSQLSLSDGELVKISLLAFPCWYAIVFIIFPDFFM